MGIKELEKKILGDQNKEAEKIINSATEKADAVIREAEAKAEQLKQEARRESLKSAENLKRSILTPARLNANKKILEAKREILDQILRSCPEEKRETKEIEVAKYLYG